MMDLRAIARHYGGTVSGGQALIPAIGHSKADRGVAIKAEPDAPDGCLIHVFNGGDPLAEKDRLRADGFLPKFEPKAKAVAGPWQTVATFEYVSADGEVIYRTVRRQPANWSGPGKRPKKFVAERLDGGRWVAGIGACERVPYRLPELRQAIDAGETVYLVEGEGKADKLANWGFAATAIAFGANGWGADYAQHFEGGNVVILPDNDDKGREFACKVYSDLKGCASPSVLELPGLPHAGDVIDWQGSAADLELLCANTKAPDWLQPSETCDKATSAFRFIAVGDLEYRAPEYLIEDLIETETLGLIFGDPGCGKSFVAADLGLSVATGTAFHGRKVKQGTVFLIAGEGHNGLTRRFAAWAKHNGVDLKGKPMFMSNRSAQFLDAGSAAGVSEAVSALAVQHGNPALIVIDTLARNYGPGDENSTSDMGGFIAAVDDLKAGFPGCAILIVHHSGHGDKQRARGAMALKGALDCEYRVEKADSTITLSNTKMKDAEPPKPVAFTLTGVDLGGGASSAVLVETDAPQRQRQLSKTQTLARDTFVEAARGSTVFAQVHLDTWQAAFLSRHTGDNDDSKKRAFRRARGELVEAGLLSVIDDHYRAECPTIIARLQV